MTEQNKRSAAMMAGVAGAVVGAGVAVAASKVMSDKKLRDKVTSTFSDFKNQVLDILDEAAEQNQIAQKGGSASRGLKASNKSQGRKRHTSKGAHTEALMESPDLAM